MCVIHEAAIPYLASIYDKLLVNNESARGVGVSWTEGIFQLRLMIVGEDCQCLFCSWMMMMLILYLDVCIGCKHSAMVSTILLFKAISNFFTY